MIYDLAIFAGGDGTRIGGGKPAVRLGGRPLVAWVATTLAPGAARTGVVAREVAAAAAVARLTGLAGVAAWIDRPGAPGPVGALLGAADVASAPFLLTAPVDTPFLPRDLAARLGAALDGGAGCAIAADEGPDGRLHPTVALYDRARLAVLEPRRSLQATIAPLAPVAVRLPPGCLFNVNTQEELAAAERLAVDAPPGV